MRSCDFGIVHIGHVAFGTIQIVDDIERSALCGGGHAARVGNEQNRIALFTKGHALMQGGEESRLTSTRYRHRVGWNQRVKHYECRQIFCCRCRIPYR